MDRRIKYTKTVIKETFLELISEKDIKKITVSEICSKADINRATFYRYYLDVYDLLDSIKKELEEELKDAYRPKDESENTVKNFSKAMLEVFIANKKIVKLLFNTNNGLYFLNSILEIAYIRCKEKWKKDLPEIPEEDMEYAAIFIFNGALGVINFWVQNDFDKDISELSETIESLSYFGTRNYIYKK